MNLPLPTQNSTSLPGSSARTASARSADTRTDSPSREDIQKIESEIEELDKDCFKDDGSAGLSNQRAVETLPDRSVTVKDPKKPKQSLTRSIPHKMSKVIKGIIDPKQTVASPFDNPVLRYLDNYFR